MIKVYASIASVGFLVLAGAAGCSSASTPDDGEGGSPPKAGTGNNTAGSSTPTAGTNSNTGGNPGTAGTSSSEAGKAPTAGTGSGGTPAVGAACKSIKTGATCAPEGTDCPNLACGLADSGVRSCMCAGTWMCASCDFTDSPFKDKPAEIETCTTEADKLSCTTMGAVCEGAAGGEVCACWTDDEGSLIWDCDKAPTSWAAM